MCFTYYKGALVWSICIAISCLLPSDELPTFEVKRIDLLVHFGFYALLAILLFLGNRNQVYFSVLRNNPMLSALFTAIVYGGFIELIQGTPWVSRSADWTDFSANAVGSLGGLVFISFLLKINKNLS